MSFLKICHIEYCLNEAGAIAVFGHFRIIRPETRNAARARAPSRAIRRSTRCNARHCPSERPDKVPTQAKHTVRTGMRWALICDK